MSVRASIICTIRQGHWEAAVKSNPHTFLLSTELTSTPQCRPRWKLKPENRKMNKMQRLKKHHQHTPSVKHHMYCTFLELRFVQNDILDYI